MGLVIGLLTLLLVLVSVLMILLILIQLPKKDAGAGLAFGAGTSDALFGAGSGTVLSRLTKYGCGVFLGLSLTLSVLYTHQAKASRQDILRELDRQATTSAVTTPPVLTNAGMPVFQPVATNLPVKVPVAPATNPAPPTAPTNAPTTPGR